MTQTMKEDGWEVVVGPSTERAGEHYGAFEYVGGNNLDRECSGGLWIKDGALYDCDGVYELPLKVITMLRAMGFTVGKDFEPAHVCANCHGNGQGLTAKGNAYACPDCEGKGVVAKIAQDDERERSGMKDVDTMAQVVEELSKRGIEAVLNYPGYILVAKGFTTCGGLHFGTVNGNWGVDVVDFNGDTIKDVTEDTEPDFSSNPSDVQAIADWIACTITQVQMNRA